MSDTTARDQLAGELLGVLAVASNFPEHAQVRLLGQDMRPLAEKCSDAILAAGWRPPVRVVTTVEELDALYDGALIVDRQGDSGYVWQGAVHYPETAVLPVDYALKHYGPFKVRYEPEEGE